MISSVQPNPTHILSKKYVVPKEHQLWCDLAAQLTHQPVDEFYSSPKGYIIKIALLRNAAVQNPDGPHKKLLDILGANLETYEQVERVNIQQP